MLIRDEPWLHPTVRAIYFANNLMDTYGLSEKLIKDRVNLEQKLMLQDFKPEPGVIYNAALAGKQGEYLGPILKEFGFECVITSNNPNTGRRIELWVRNPEETIEPEV